MNRNILEGNMDASTAEMKEEKLLNIRSDSSSDGSNHSSQSKNNPLMKLVDAALRPTSPMTKKVTTDTSSGEAVKEDDVTEVSAEGLLTDQKGKDISAVDETGIIRGTLRDLVRSQEKKITFAEFLMQCLNDEANSDVLQWMPCGTQFTITNHRRFTMERMPQLFKIRNMSSFVRKLTRWGFSRVHEKETGNSDIFKHVFFLRDKPELCRKIRCVTRVIAEANKMSTSLGGRNGNSVLMDNISESVRHHGMDFDHDMSLRLVSPRRSVGHSAPLYSGRSPHSMDRFQSHHTPRISTAYLAPRISPESEKEMMERSVLHAQLNPPQVYTPPLIGRTMSAAAEYELEQVLLERHRARLFREEQQYQLQAAHQRPDMRNHSLDVSIPTLRSPLESSSERSSDSISERRFASGHALLTPTSDSHPSTFAALEKLHRDGEYDLDMSPREAMLRAVLHKRQQQRAAQHQRGNSGSGILKLPYNESTSSSRTTTPGNYPSYYR